jgi:peptidoglycan/xylan/chitin deacetylase (PgdA/CDA1 family)
VAEILHIAAYVAAGAVGAGVAAFAFVFLVQPSWAVPMLERLTPQVLYRVKTSAPLVALSFDDGPHPENTPRVLEILQRYDARATFFLIGDRAERQPDVVAAIRAGGHEIGNHYLYYRHGFALAHSDDEFARHLRDVERVLGLPEGRDARPKIFSRAGRFGASEPTASRARDGLHAGAGQRVSARSGAPSARVHALADCEKSRAGSDRDFARRHRRRVGRDSRAAGNTGRGAEPRAEVRFDWGID